MENVILHGSSADGSDARVFRGVYTNPNNDNEWSSAPYTKEQRDFEREDNRQHRLYMEVLDYMDGTYTLDDVKKQIDDKVCSLPGRCRRYVLVHYDEDGNFKED